jgi:protein-S-isoprenylcysteine O-methyltransferase Ste14
MKKHLIQAGRILFKYRAFIAVPFFILLFIFSKPAPIKVIPYFIIFIGLFIRIWAAGYIGQKARATGFTTGCRIMNAPYKYLKHPLYIGNFFLVLGIVILFNPATWFAVLLMILFLLIYTVIIISELHYLKYLPKIKAQFKLTNCKGEISTIVIVIIILIIYHILTYTIK